MEITKLGARKLDGLEARIQRAEADAEAARQEWAALVRHLGIAAVARRMEISRQTLTERLQVIENRR